jgi:hypothetical protein
VEMRVLDSYGPQQAHVAGVNLRFPKEAGYFLTKQLLISQEGSKIHFINNPGNQSIKSL